ncbi:MAG: hypothetical protein HUK22_07875, partial [Thermoguttaceae bacterium]|nr:hypothetical protein [Thermoguttaceae bacterium]
ATKLAAAPPIRVYRFPVWFPPSFQETASDARLRERVLWDAATLFPKYPFSRGIAIIDARGAASDSAYAAFVNALLNREGGARDAAFLGTRYIVGPQIFVDRLTSSGARTGMALAVKEIAPESRRAWIFRENQPNERPGERAKVLLYQPNRVVYFVELEEAADVVFLEQFWPDWRAVAIPLTSEQKEKAAAARYDVDATNKLLAEIDGDQREIPIENAFGFLRQIKLQRGCYCIETTYRPRALYRGAALGATGWCCVIAAFVVALWRRAATKRKKRETANSAALYSASSLFGDQIFSATPRR